MNKFKLISCVVSVALMSGCATNAQNAALVGAIGGAIIATELNQPRQFFVAPPRARPLTCYTQLVGRDVYGRAVYQQVCR